MKYLLDTCVVSDFIKGERGTLTTMQHLSPSTIVLSSINPSSGLES